jgi:hypothetical protein
MSVANDKPIGCWIASYPRSGNTFLRFVLSNILVGSGQAATLDRDFPEFVAGRPLSLEGARLFEGSAGRVVFCKTHHQAPPETEALAAIRHGVYIHRHPLDVFLSGLNYLYLNAPRIPAFANYFAGGRPKRVEQIAADGEMGAYFDRFLEDDGIAAFRGIAGRWSRNLAQWLDAAAASEGRIVAVDYVDLIGDTRPLVEGLFARLGLAVPPERIVRGIDWARGATRPDGGFFWKGKPGTYRDFLTPEQIARFFDRHEPAWRRHGIAFPR